MKSAEFLLVFSGLIVFLALFIGVGYGLSKFQEKHPNLYSHLFVYSTFIYFLLPFLESLPLLYEQILMAIFIPLVIHGLFNKKINEAFNINVSIKTLKLT